MDETDIYNKIRNNWAGLDIIRIESSASNGIPDLNFCHEGFDVWMELKILHGDRIYLERFQSQFHVRRNRAGGKSIIFAADPKRIKVLRLSDPLALSKAIDKGKFRVYDTSDPTLLELVIQWDRPFVWKTMFSQFMEKIRCL